MKQQTAVEWLFKHIEGIRIIDGYEFIKLQEAFEQAKQMEKEQIINARRNGFEQSHDRFHFQEWEGLDEQIGQELNSEKYYNEIYNK